jgi:transcriptional antiterminator RfaH
MNWFVLYTNSRAELKVAQRLEQLGVETYCPVRMEVRERSDRKKTIAVPLLPSMVLVKIEEKNRNRVFEVQGVVRYLYWLSKPACVTEEEVSTLKQITLGRGFIKHTVEKLALGTEINLSTFSKNGVIVKVSEKYQWITLKGLNCTIKLTIA